MAAPGRGKAVVDRQAGVRVAGNVEHREIVADKRPGQAPERDRDEHELALRGRPRDSHPGGVATKAADQRHERLHDGDAQGDDESEVTELGNHV